MKQSRVFLRRCRGLFLSTSLLLVAGIVVSGCEALLPSGGEPTRLYRLTPKSTFNADMPSVDWQLVIEVPFASASVNTTRIGIMTSPTRFEYYADANWTDRAPIMTQTLMVESFENSDRIVAVGRESIGLRPDFILKTELRELQSEIYEDRKQVRVGLNAKLVLMPDRIIVGAAKFEHTVPLESNELGATIEAFDAAFGRSVKELIDWTLKTGEAAYVPARGVRRELKAPDS